MSDPDEDPPYDPDPVRALQVVGAWLAVAGVPGSLLALSSLAPLLWTTQLQPGEKLVPTLTWASVVAPVAAGVFGVALTVAALWFGLLHVKSPAWRAFLFSVLVPGLLFLAGLGVAGAIVGATPLLAGDVPVDRAESPSSKQRALLYRDDWGPCGWDVYIADGVDPVARHHQRVDCQCEHMPTAHVAWTSQLPDLQDAAGQPYACPYPPRCRCDSSPGGASLGVALAVIAALLRRERQRPRGAGRSPAGVLRRARLGV